MFINLFRRIYDQTETIHFHVTKISQARYALWKLYSQTKYQLLYNKSFYDFLVCDAIL